MVHSTELSPPPIQHSTYVQLARGANLATTSALACCVVLQVLFAGAGALLSPDYWPMHRAFGYSLQCLAIFVPITAVLARLPRRSLVLNLVVYALILVQDALIWLPGRGGLPFEIRALHAVNALVLFVAAVLALRVAYRLTRNTQRVPRPQIVDQTATVGIARADVGWMPVLGCALAMPLGLLACSAIAFVSWNALASTQERNPYGSETSARPESVAGGQATFEQRCAMCHATSDDFKIGPGLARLFDPGGPRLPAGVDYEGRLPNGAEITDAAVAEWIRSGGRGQIGQMPPRNLSNQEMAGVIAYLKTLR
jgi:mono/diheme cytochrome c family protein